MYLEVLLSFFTYTLWSEKCITQLIQNTVQTLRNGDICTYECYFFVHCECQHLLKNHRFVLNLSLYTAYVEIVKAIFVFVAKEPILVEYEKIVIIFIVEICRIHYGQISVV